MRWLLSGSLLGGLGALLSHWQWPFAAGVSLAGFAVLLFGFLGWLASGRRTHQARGEDGWLGSGSGHDCHAGGDGGGGDGGCGGD